ncbi:Actin-binding LIM protein 3, partial [Sarracenia purpurea var. burkii]
MKVLVESIRSETPRPKSPHMNNEEPIELAHFRLPNHLLGEKAKIERDEFPAAPYPYSDPERRKRWSDSYKEVSISDDEDEVDRVEKHDSQDKIKKEEEELSKIASGIGKVFLQNLKEREKLQKWKQSHIDPRNASRCPSASKEPAYRSVEKIWIIRDRGKKKIRSNVVIAVEDRLWDDLPEPFPAIM